MSEARRAYIRVLESASREPREFKEDDLEILGELIKGGYIAGDTLTRPAGDIRGAAVTGMTVQGRLFLDQLREQDRKEGPWAQTKAWFLPVGTFVAGLVSGLLGEWLKKAFGM